MDVLKFSSAEEFNEKYNLLLPDTLESTQAHKQKIRQLQAICERYSLRTPWPHQLIYASLFSLRKRNLLAWGLGTGKTATAIYILYLTYLDNFHKLKPGSILIVTPNQNVCNQVWMKELTTLGLGKFSAYVNSYNSITKCDKPIWVMPYRLLINQTKKGLALKRAGLGLRTNDKTGKKYFLGEQVYKYINKVVKPKFLIADEAHRLGDNLSQTSNAMREISRRCRHVLALTGSPLDGYIRSLASVLSFIYGENNELFPYKVDTFEKLFSQTVQVNQDYRTGKATGKLRKLPGVKASKLSLYFHGIRHLIHRLTIQNEIVNKYVKYPTEIKQRLKVDLSFEHSRLYKNAIFSRENLLKLVKQLDNNELDIDKPGINRAIAIRELDYLKQIVNCPWNVIDTRKINIKIEDISKAHLCKSVVEKHLALGHKGIIFIHHVAVGFQLKQFLENQLKIKIARIYATDKYSRPTEMSLDDRERQIIEFQNDPDIKLLITNTELCSEGLNLVEATYGIFYDYGWKSVAIEQASKRYARPGQLSQEVYTYYLESNNTVDTYVLDTLLAKTSTNSKVLDLDFSALMWQAEKAIEVEDISNLGFILKNTVNFCDIPTTT